MCGAVPVFSTFIFIAWCLNKHQEKFSLFPYLLYLSTINVCAFADWQKLREEHRIVGALIGCLAHLPRQDSFLGLPMVLLPEEVTLLLEQKVARLVSYSSLRCAPSSDVRQKFQEYRKTMYKQQVCKTGQ